MIKSKVVFDIDGVLINTSRSYRRAIKKTAEYLVKKKIDIADVDFLKQQAGFNNDWFCAYILTNIHLNNYKLYEFDKISSDNEKVSYQVVKDVFQTYYLGSGNYSPSKFSYKKGLREKETSIFSPLQIQSLYNRYGKPVILTGRTTQEATYVLQKFGLLNSFSQIVSVEDDINLNFDIYPDLKVFGKDKSNPIYLYALENIKDYNQIFYIGDSISDLKLVFNARKYFNIYSIFFLGSYKKREQKPLIEIAKQYNPDYIVYDVHQAISVLQTI